MYKQTITAIQSRMNNGETRFHIGAYYYECNVNGTIRRREQQPGRTATSDWERVGSWNPSTWTITE